MNSVDASTRLGWRAGVVLAEGTFQDPTNARVIYIAAGGLLLLGLALAVGTWWWWRSAKVEHPALGPLEVMGSRSWRKGDFNNRVKTIERARPANAIHEAELADPDELDVEAIDLAAMSRADPVHFGDFSDLLPAAADESALDGPAIEPANDEPVSDVPVSDEAAADEPVSDNAVSDEAAGDEPAGDEPAGVDSAAEAVPVAAATPVPEPDPVALQLAFDDPLPDSASGPIDPLLRLNTE